MRVGPGKFKDLMHWAFLLRSYIHGQVYRPKRSTETLSGLAVRMISNSALLDISPFLILSEFYNYAILRNVCTSYYFEALKACIFKSVGSVGIH